MLDAAISAQDVLDLNNAEQLARLFVSLGYSVEGRIQQTPRNLGITDDTLERSIRRVEQLAARDGVEVWLFELARTGVQVTRQITHAFRLRAGNFLLVLTQDYESLDLVLVETRPAPSGTNRQPTARPWVITIERRKVSRVALRVLCRVTFTEEDGYDQHDKMLASFQSAEWSRDWFHNRGLFSDHFLEDRLPPRDTDALRRTALADFKALFADARRLLGGQIEQAARDRLLTPALARLGFDIKEAKGASDPRRDHPDYWLLTPGGTHVGLCLTYPWGRSLDGPDAVRDTQTSDEDPVAVAVHLLLESRYGVTWAIVTNGKHWRLFSRRASSVASSYLEVDLEEILAASDGLDGFKYFWGLFHRDAFAPHATKVAGRDVVQAHLDDWFDESQAHARELEARLKGRVYQEVFPAFGGGFIRAIQARDKRRADLSEERLREVFEATLTLLYRVLFALYAEARDLLPAREVRGYWECSITRLRDEIVEVAGTHEGSALEKLASHYSDQETGLYDRLIELAKTIAEGNPARNVPLYNGGLFVTSPAPDDDGAEARNARFLSEWKLSDRALAIGLHALTRDVDPRSHGLVNLDYRDLGVRQLGSIYEGLLEHQFKVKGKDVSIEARSDARHASGSYYTPEHLVRFVVERTLGPVMRAHLKQMAVRFEAARQGEIDGATLTDEFFDLTVVDPAMGSGHFLVTAIDWITDQLVDFLAAHPGSALQAELLRTRQTILDEVEAQGVTIDAHQLTDLALLRRFILKRCVFGVDLNPMAVELAKVSVWLHCFTLGAPLSLLDHHLRCGNSLAGVTVEEVREAKSVKQRTLFDADNFEPLQKATERMREVVRMPDLTPAEAKKSRAAYQEALGELRVLKRLLDVYCAHYLIPVPARERDSDHHPVVAFLSTSAAGQMGRLKNPRDALSKKDASTRERITKALDLALEHRFFHWELEFPEIFYRAKRRAKVRGFDAMIGNPPWIRQEGLKALKAVFEVVHHRVFDPVADIYVSFIGRGRDLLRGGGHLGMVLPDKWFHTEYATKLRRTLGDPLQFSPRVLVDFGHAPSLFDADTFPCILVVERSGSTSDKGLAEPLPMRFCKVERDGHGATVFEQWLKDHWTDVPLLRLSSKVWSLVAGSEGALMDRIRTAGVALHTHVGSQPLYGVKTGFSRAFLIDQDTRDDLVNEDPNCKALIKKFLRGENLGRWVPTWGGEWMIFTRKGVDIDAYPSIKKHLKAFRTELTPCPADWDVKKNGPWNGRKAGSYEWYEIQDNVAYFEQFNHGKIYYQRYAFHSRFALDTQRLYANDATSFIPSSDLYLLGVLNSSVIWWFAYRDCAHKKTETLAFDMVKVREFPIPDASEDRRDVVRETVSSVLALTKQQHAEEASFWKFLAKRTGVTKRSRKLECFWTLDAEGFLDEVRKAKGTIATGPGRTALLADFETHRATLRHLRTEVCKLEIALQQHVCDLYGLTSEEVELLRRTAPPRDPWTRIEAEARDAGYDLR